MPKQHLVMLAHKFDPLKYGVGGWFASEKRDGHRVLNIPGTRGLRKDEVPFANLYDTKRHGQIATGLWSRYGNIIVAPEWFLDDLPALFLDGEMAGERGQGGRQAVASTIRKLEPIDSEWEEMTYRCFDMPSPEMLFADRDISLPNYTRQLRGCLEWWRALNVEMLHTTTPVTRFESALFLLRKHLKSCAYVVAHDQFQLSFQTGAAQMQVEVMVETISEREGEGVILREPSSVWETFRSHKLLKVKPLEDAEGTVLGYTTGKETDKGSKLLGMMGALVLMFNGRRFELSGFTDDERQLGWTPGICHAEAEMSPTEWAATHPGEEVPYYVEATAFPRGSVVSFKYRDLTRDGLPNEARYWRKRIDV